MTFHQVEFEAARGQSVGSQQVGVQSLVRYSGDPLLLLLLLLSFQYRGLGSRHWCRRCYRRCRCWHSGNGLGVVVAIDVVIAVVVVGANVVVGGGVGVLVITRMTVALPIAWARKLARLWARQLSLF